MEVTINNNLIEIVKDDGTEIVINGSNVVDEGSIRWEQYNTVPPILGSDPFTQPNPTSVDRYKIVIHFNDNRWEEIPLGTVTNQAGWTDDLTGAETAVADISAALLVSGGGGGGVSSVSASSPLSSSGGATPTISHQTSGVTAAAYTVNGEALFTVNATGHITAASNATIPVVPAGSDTQVQFNNSGALGASADLTFDGSVLAVGADDGDGIVELGAVGGSGEVSSPGTLNVEGQDIGVSAADTVTISTAATSRLAIDADGTFNVNGSDGTDGQYLKSTGSASEAEWATIQASEVDINTFFFATVNGVRSLYIEVFQGVDPPNRYWSVNGVESVDNAIFGASGAWTINQDSNNVAASTDAVANPVLVTTWTGAATVDIESPLYGATVQETLEQLAATQDLSPTIEMVVTQSGTDVPVAVAIKRTNTDAAVTFTREEEGLFYLTCTGFITERCQLMITSNVSGRSAYILASDTDTAYFSTIPDAVDNAAFSITLKQL
ncbi:MAG TPA: hypothetical protein PKJ19_06490 [Flavobacteriales bacterium]|nr:hypothetical protein [Flavobacteriales bacterium]